MAYFRLRVDAQSWFSEVRRSTQFKTSFDFYYFCLMAGFASERDNEQALIGTLATDLVEDFTNDYKPSKLLLIGLLVIVELKKEGIDVEEKAAVRQTIKRLVDPASQNQLTDQGVRRMNAYASGGYEYLAETRNLKPYSADEFLRDFVVIIKTAISALAKDKADVYER